MVTCSMFRSYLYTTYICISSVFFTFSFFTFSLVIVIDRLFRRKSRSSFDDSSIYDTSEEDQWNKRENISTAAAPAGSGSAKGPGPRIGKDGYKPAAR